MDSPSYLLTEIDTTPFKTLDDLAYNISRRYRISHGVFPKYLPPPNVAVQDATVHSIGHIDIVVCNCTEDDAGVTSTVDASRDVTSGMWDLSSSWGNLSTSWNFTQVELGINVTREEEAPGWWGSGESMSGAGGEWGPGLLAVTGLALYTLALCTAVGNALVIHAIRTEKRLQTVSNLFIMSLAAADLTVGVIVMPISAAYAMMGEWRLGLVVCQFWLAADYTASTASIFNLVILSLDRYWSITAPLRYLRRRTRRRAWVMIGASWTAATAWLVPVLAWHHLALGGIRSHPPHVCETEFSTSAAFKAVTAALNFYLPTALMLYLYCRIFREVQSRQVLGRVPFTSHDLVTDSCSEVERHSRPPHQARNNQSSSHNLPSITANNECSQFRSLTVVSPGSDDCSHYSGVVVSVEYLPEEIDQTSPTHHHHLNHQQSQQQQQQQQQQQHQQLSPHQQNQLQQQRRQAAANRLGPHHNHIHCYQSTTRPHSSWDPSTHSPHRAREQKWGSSWRLSTLSQGANSPRITAPATTTTTATNGTRKKRTVACTNSGGGGGGGGGARRVEGVNLAKERKAARQLGVIVGAFMACWVPYFTLFPIMALCDTCVPAHAHTATIWLGYLNSALNPVLYPLCNHNFRRAFARMLRLPTRKSNNYANAHRLATITVRH
ncbi:histamine H1 receptor-like [Homarus americanus]|uniref:histamine H1 receptor-like n=1 Tax=Homarus americanus TaxID=6706 RepID=UPI001C461179|nr:histamine H1 receptor-like [Homarus americanus]XP_042208023.1 histamine H1 receptor-like [Homarus americanus]